MIISALSAEAQSYMNLECDVALRTHMCERGTVPSEPQNSATFLFG